MASFGVGAVLRQERIRQQLSLDELARQTKISHRFLEAIESENFEQMPGLVFARSFVRQYALALKMDPETILSGLPKVDIETTPMPAPQRRSRRSTFDPRWNAALSSIAWSVLAVGAVVAAYTYYNRPPEPGSPHKSVRATPGALIADSTVKSQQKQAAPAPAVSQPAAPRTEGRPAAVEESAGSHPVKVTLTAREASWVQITADGKPAFTGTLQPNDQQNVSADDIVKVLTGNAGGVEISLNGKPIDPLGPSGQVRTVRLTAEGPQFVAKVPPSTSDPL